MVMNTVRHSHSLHSTDGRTVTQAQSQYSHSQGHSGAVTVFPLVMVMNTVRNSHSLHSTDGRTVRQAQSQYSHSQGQSGAVTVFTLVMVMKTVNHSFILLSSYFRSLTSWQRRSLVVLVCLPIWVYKFSVQRICCFCSSLVWSGCRLSEVKVVIRQWGRNVRTRIF